MGISENAKVTDLNESGFMLSFLKNEIKENIENILQKTLYEAREKKGFTVLEETVSKTLKQVMEIRESLLKRIKDIRKGETN